MKTNIGKNTLGDNNKMQLSLHNYNRSTHDLSFVMRTTMAPGVLVPTMKLLMEPGDTFDIETRYHTLTHPTIGPLFGSFKQQNDYFFCPIRLYNAMLHNNTLNIGLDMGKVKLPKFKWNETNYNSTGEKYLNGSNGTLYQQVHPSSLLAYLGYRTLSRSEDFGTLEAQWQAVPIIAYFDIFKNYYANKQESSFYTISGSVFVTNIQKKNQSGWVFMKNNDGTKKSTPLMGMESASIEESEISTNISIYVSGTDITETEAQLNITITGTSGQKNVYTGTIYELIQQDILKSNPTMITEYDGFQNVDEDRSGENYVIINKGAKVKNVTISEFIANNNRYLKYSLDTIDKLREYILAAGRGQVYISSTNAPFIQDIIENDGKGIPLSSNPMQGLCLKTYQSDINVNWVKTEWIDGDNGINAITAIDTSSGSFSIDQLNLAEKVYKMLNRIAVSDGSYNAWIQTIFTSGGLNHIETPIYIGGQSQEIEFQEVISQSTTESEPLGSLAGRGVITQRKGNKIRFKADEPGYIMCITSITPRVDYFQGNEWDIYLDNIDQLHKPQLDGIGFQDRLIRNINSSVPKEQRLKSIGKQPAWIEYMTNINKTFGNFALIESEGWMCLNRIFGNADTYTTYIQPHLYNSIFAETEPTSQNFWVQIGFNIEARRVMSAKQIPNL